MSNKFAKTDARGIVLTEGQLIAYSVRHGATVRIKFATILTADLCARTPAERCNECHLVVVKTDTKKTVKLTALRNIVVVENVRRKK